MQTFGVDFNYERIQNIKSNFNWENAIHQTRLVLCKLFHVKLYYCRWALNTVHLRNLIWIKFIISFVITKIKTSDYQNSFSHFFGGTFWLKSSMSWPGQISFFLLFFGLTLSTGFFFNSFLSVLTLIGGVIRIRFIFVRTQL